jgi:RNA methyltransferase, TrmH family
MEQAFNPDSLTPLSRSGETLLGKLGQRKYRKIEGLFVAEGVRLLEEALECGVTIAWAVAAPSGSDGEGLTPRARALVERIVSLGAPVYRAEPRVLKRVLDPVQPQPVAAVCRIPDRALETWSVPERALVAVCDRINQPGNLGSLIRVAAASGADAVIAVPGTVDFYNPKCVRGAMGALFRLHALDAGSPEALLDFLGRHSFAVYEAAAGGTDIFEAGDFPARTAVIFGSEAEGSLSLPPGPSRPRLSVPMYGGVESLNVAVAAGIILYRIARGRKA